MLRLMVIGATWEQIPLIQEAKKLGFNVLATATSKDAEGLSYADKQELVDPRDLIHMLKIAKSYQPNGIASDECDYSHYANVFVSENLGLPHDGLKSSQLTTNKLWMRDACHKARILQPRFIGCRTIEDAKRAIEVIGLPVIVKPVDNRGASGVKVVNSIENLKEAYLDALMNAYSREVIVEAYIEGIHITVDGCVDQDGIHHNLAIASKKVTKGNKPIIFEVNYPAKITDENREYIMQTNSQVVDALNISSGLTHSEYILDGKGRCFLVETANRGGGVYTSAKIIPIISGINISELLISNAIGRSFEIKLHPYLGEVVLRFFIFKPGNIVDIRGIEKVKSFHGVEFIKLFIRPGDILNAVQSGAERHGFVILKSTNSNSIDQLYQKVMDSVLVVYKDDK